MALLAPPVPSLGLGIGTALAAQGGYHTRKKVNGRWVTGRFRNGAGASAGTAAAPAETQAAAADTPAAGAQAAAAPPATRAGRRVRFTEKKGFAKTRYSSLPRMKAKVVLKTEAPKDAAPSVPLPPPAPIAQVPPAKSPALGSKADLPPDRVLATASIHPAPVAQPGAERMRSALEARARTMAGQLGVPAVPLPEAAPAARLSARSVTYDIGAGTRTIVFDDGATVTAPFDKTRAETLNGLSPSR